MRPTRSLGKDSFKPDNPLHTLLSIESKVVSPSQVEWAYEKVGAVFKKVKSKKPDRLNPEDRIKLVYEVLLSEKLRLNTSGNWGNPLFVHNLLQGCLDCDTSSFIVLAVGFELGWPVHLVNVPGHSFVRWDNGKGERFNIDFGKTHPDVFYLKEWNLDQAWIAKGYYLKNLNFKELTSIFLANRSLADTLLFGKDEEAIQDLNRAIKLRPLNPRAYRARGFLNFKLERYQDALRDFLWVSHLDPKNREAFGWIGKIYWQMGYFARALQFFKRADEFERYG